MAEPINVIIEDDDDSVRTDPRTGAVEVNQPDGGVVVYLHGLPKEKADKDEQEDWFKNLADEMSAQELAVIANELHEAILADDNSRKQSLANYERGLDLLGLEIKEPRSSVSDGSSGSGIANVTNPLLLEACLKGWANAQAELLPANGPVKIKDDGNADQVVDDLAEVFERDLNHWFTTTAAEFYPDTSHMLLWGVYFRGSGIKKAYRCPMRRRPVSESVEAKDFIVSDATKDLRACGRITHQISLRQSVMKRMMHIGAYRDVSLIQPTPTTNEVTEKIGEIQGVNATKSRPEDQPYTLWETQCELDLDKFVPTDSDYKGEGIPLPFRVTMDKDSREILAIRRDWHKGDTECHRIRLYVKYPYIPGPGFYGTGMLNILGNSSAAMTAAWCEALDAGMFASFPGGLVEKLEGRQNTNIIRAAPGEFIPIQTNGKPIQQTVMPMPYKDVTGGLLQLMQLITEGAKGVSGAAEVPVGEGLQDVAVGTMLTAVEQATKIMSAAHKGMHQAMSEEIQLIVELFRDNPEDFWRGNPNPASEWDEQKFNTALEKYKTRLVPVSDPNVPSHIHRVAKAVALTQVASIPIFTPYFEKMELLSRVLRAIREDPRGLIREPPPQQAQPSLKDMADLTAAQAKMKDAETKGMKAQLEAKTADQKNQLTLFDISTKRQVSQNDLQKEAIMHAHDGERAKRQDAVATLTAVHDAHAKARDHALDVADHQRNLVKDQADYQLGHRKLDIEEHKAKHPPKPAAPKKSK